MEKCSICNRFGYGPTIKCENGDCKIRFHVECARINKYQMEFIDNSNGEVIDYYSNENINFSLNITFSVDYINLIE